MSNSGPRDGLVRPLLIGLGLALIIYFGAFSFLQHSRVRKGGWIVTFTSDPAAIPSLRVAQPYLGITNVSFVFPGAHLDKPGWQQTIVFDQPITNAPFGKVIYIDTTFLPGAIVFDLFGHEIQLLPRVLLLDHREVPWKSGREFSLPLAGGGTSPKGASAEGGASPEAH